MFGSFGKALDKSFVLQAGLQNPALQLLGELEGINEKTFAHLAGLEEVSFPTGFAFAAAQWPIPADQALVADRWAWLENQVMAAVEVVPLGQTDGQRILLMRGERPFYSQISKMEPACLPSSSGCAPTFDMPTEERFVIEN